MKAKALRTEVILQEDLFESCRRKDLGWCCDQKNFITSVDVRDEENGFFEERVCCVDHIFIRILRLGESP